MAKKQALGRGLDALISTPELPRSVDNESLIDIEIRFIEVNPFQPRTNFDEETLNELAASIKELGIIQPITIRKIRENKYQLITGERRLRASKIAGLKTIPAYIRTIEDQSLLEMALVENIQREDLDAIEIAISYQRLIEECKLTQESLSERVGKKRSTVSNYLRLLKLPAEIQLGIRSNQIQIGHAKSLISIEDENAQLKLFYRIINQDLSVRKAEELVRELKSKKEKKNNDNKNLPGEYDQLRNQLSKYFNTKIQFNINNNGKGKIVIPFKSDDELEHIIGIFDKLNF
ncbi:MAG: ParB/RepB/Spo0J family partition protein [Chlorobi bacterium]|nr:ParB/RepB/Spo0J family partition protein [Chlorobiota bacterium]